ncbi:hypothetical protein A11S_328 [Micavibrio aeruginosavorus EPB]|uniref:Uncharacterized protein n=1 Tax=Micavibrio aeruginosavorus EPB TaxID=349215 RepID=M4VD60_9BACT|nr:hypothetical protein A11S_328 [Micavibrio aeruginosavorus EPB]
MVSFVIGVFPNFVFLIVQYTFVAPTSRGGKQYRKDIEK